MNNKEQKPSLNKNPVRKSVLASARPAFVTLFGLQSIRLVLPGFTYYLREVRGLSSLTLAPIALIVFSLTFISIYLVKKNDIDKSIRIVVLLLAAARVIEITSVDPAIDLFLSAGSSVLFGVYIPLGLLKVLAGGKHWVDRYALMILLGAALDHALHAGLGSLDLSWQSGLFPVVLVLLLSLFLIGSGEGASGFAQSPVIRTRWRHLWPFIAVGPWLFLQLQIFQNMGFIGALTGWSFPSVAWWIWMGNAAGIAGAIAVTRFSGRYGRFLLLGLGTVLVMLLTAVVQVEGWAAAIVFLLGHVLAAVLFTAIMVLGVEVSPAKKPQSRVAFYSSLGFILFVMIFFVYYASYDLALGFRANQVLPLVALLITLGAVGAAGTQNNFPSGKPPWGLIAAQVSLLIVPVILFVSWQPVVAVGSDPAMGQMKVMTYNLHQGFNTAGQLNIEALAQVIEAEQPDIIALQEVTRSWVINGSLDMLPWLSHRLGYPYIWGPTDPPQWGNAILSRYPVVASAVLPLSPKSLSLRRGFIDAAFQVGGAHVRILATHLHHPSNGSPIRQVQTDELLEYWGGTPYTILIGDLNAVYEDPEMVALAEAGLIETVRTQTANPPGTFFSENPSEQIDYIWVTPDLITSDYRVPVTTASDHLPVIVELRIDNP